MKNMYIKLHMSPISVSYTHLDVYKRQVQGSAIDDYIISSLLKLGIMSVYIREGSADPDDPDAIRSPKAAAMVKQLRCV